MLRVSCGDILEETSIHNVLTKEQRLQAESFHLMSFLRHKRHTLNMANLNMQKENSIDNIVSILFFDYRYC